MRLHYGDDNDYIYQYQNSSSLQEINIHDVSLSKVATALNKLRPRQN